MVYVSTDRFNFPYIQSTRRYVKADTESEPTQLSRRKSKATMTFSSLFSKFKQLDCLFLAHSDHDIGYLM